MYTWKVLDRKQDNAFMVTSSHWCEEMLGVSVEDPGHLTVNKRVAKKAPSATGLGGMNRIPFLGLVPLLLERLWGDPINLVGHTSDLQRQRVF